MSEVIIDGEVITGAKMPQLNCRLGEQPLAATAPTGHGDDTWAKQKVASSGQKT